MNILENIQVNENNQHLISVEGVLFHDNWTELIQYPIGRVSTSSTIKIREKSFHKLQLFTITDTITSTGNEEFEDKLELKDVKYIYHMEPSETGVSTFRNTPFCSESISKELFVGRCGENVRWIIENNELTIYGSGDTEDDIPWKDIRTRTIIIEEAATSIGTNCI